ncbi:MAG: hypothetical protein GX299_03220 [Epulopiscium sp.]|jgi:hypothetical protein|nr:hypothetical protein [Candidatus Epulonipiscium sp.]
MAGGKEDFFPDKEKGKNISAMSQKDDGMDMDFMKMADTIKMFQTMMSVAENNKLPKNSAPEPEEEDDALPFNMNRRERILQAAIPFLDQEYQRNLYIVVRLLEMKRVLGQESVMLESRSRKVDDSHIRQRKLLNAVRPYLSGEEKARVDWMVKIMDMKTILERKEDET